MIPALTASCCEDTTRPKGREIYKRSVASKLHEAVTALFCVAQPEQMTVLADDIRCAGPELYRFGELS